MTAAAPVPPFWLEFDEVVFELEVELELEVVLAELVDAAAALLLLDEAAALLFDVPPPPPPLFGSLTRLSSTGL